MFPRHTKSIFCILLIVFLPCGWFLRYRLAGVFCQELLRFCLAGVLCCQGLLRFCQSGGCSMLSRAAPLLSVWQVFSTALRSCYPGDEGDQKAFCSPSSGLPNPLRLTSATPIRGISRHGAVPSGLFSRPRRSWPAFQYAKIINALQINPLDIDASGYIIDTLCVMILSPCQEVHLKRGLDSLYSSEDNRKSLSFSELQLSSGNTSLPRGSGFCLQMPPELRKLPAILSCHLCFCCEII